MNKEKEIFKTRTSTIWMDESGILHSIYSEGMDVELDDVKENMGVVNQLLGGKSAPYIIDIRGVHSVTREARRTSSSPDATNAIKALALLVGSSVSRVIGNFFVGISKTTYPVKMFSSEEKAMEWLKKYLKKDEIENE